MARTTREKSSGFNAWLGWGISTLLLLFLNRNNNSSSEDEQDPDKYKDDNFSQIGSPVPAIIGRAMLKNPLVSYYGAWRADIYTEEYGMWTELDAAGILWPFLLDIIVIIAMPAEHPVVTNTGAGVATDSENGVKNQLIVMAILNALITMLLWLFTNHSGRTTIQKGFLYYLGWQHILCWTGDNLGIKSLYMNVYNSELEASTEQAVWDNGIAWKKDNLTGMTVYIDNYDMFGGVDEQGGFVGHIRFYFGDTSQPKDTWMINQMSDQSTIPQELLGLTPKYPDYFTCVISNPDLVTGAYIGRQCTIPEMWFEIVNYPDRLARNHAVEILNLYKEKLNLQYDDIINYYDSMSDAVKDSIGVLPSTSIPTSIRAHVEGTIQGLIDDINSATDASAVNTILPDLVTALDDLEAIWPPNDLENLKNLTEQLKSLSDHQVFTLGRLGDDENPAEAIYEILKNELWGCDYTDDRIDIESLLSLGVVCEQEGLGVSLCMDTTQPCNVYINSILQHINGVKYDDPVTGKLTFYLIRDDFDANSLRLFDVSNCESCEYTRMDWSETKSSVTVNFINASDKYVDSSFLMNDPSNRYITGYYTETSVDGSYFTEAKNAKWLASVTLLSCGYPLSAVNLVVNRSAYDLKIGEPFKLTWNPYGIVNAIYRVVDIDYSNISNGSISLSAIEDVFSFQRLSYSRPEDLSWNPKTPDPDDIEDYLFVEMPYEYMSTLNTYIYAYALQPSTNTVRWNVWRLLNGAYQLSASSVAFSTGARMTYGVAQSFNTEVNGIQVTPQGINSTRALMDKINLINSYPSTYTNTSKLNIILVDNELMSYESIEPLANGDFLLTNVLRGILDTLPEEHSSYSPVFFMETGMNILSNGSYVCLAGFTNDESLGITGDGPGIISPFDTSTANSFVTTRRAERPSVMANLKLDGDRSIYTNAIYLHQPSPVISGNFKFEFIPRNKFQSQQIVAQTDDTTFLFTPTSGTKYWLRIVYGSDVDETVYWDALDNNGDAIDNFVLDWHTYCEIMGNYLSYYQTVSMYVGSYDQNTGLNSYAEYSGTRTTYIPQMVGIVATLADAQALADSIAIYSANSVLVPAIPGVSPDISVSFYECPLIFLGTPDPLGIYNQDGQYWTPSTIAYRIDGCDSSGVCTLTQIDVSNEFVFRSNYTTDTNNYAIYKKWNSTVSSWDSFSPNPI